MNWCDRILGIDSTTPNTGEMAEVLAARVAELPLADLVRGWREVATTRYRDFTLGTGQFRQFFNGLSRHHPERGLALIDAIVSEEPDDEIVALVTHEFLLPQLVLFHACQRFGVVARLEALSIKHERVRWLMGGLWHTIQASTHGSVQRRLFAIADKPAWDAWLAKDKGGQPTTAFQKLAVPDLARTWIDLMDRSAVERERDQNFTLWGQFEYALVRENPERALAMCDEIVQTESNPQMIALLAAGLFENLLPRHPCPMLDRIEARARVNPRFRELLWGAWFSGLAPEVVARLKGARQDVA